MCATGGWEERRSNWQKTGLVAVRDMGLAELLPDLFQGCGEAKVADLSGNALEVLPPQLACLTRLQVGFQRL